MTPEASSNSASKASGTAAVCVAVALAGPAFLYFCLPQVLARLLESMADRGLMPPPVYESTFAPIYWLYDNVAAYRAYIDFINDIL